MSPDTAGEYRRSQRAGGTSLKGIRCVGLGVAGCTLGGVVRESEQLEELRYREWHLGDVDLDVLGVTNELEYVDAALTYYVETKRWDQQYVGQLRQHQLGE